MTWTNAKISLQRAVRRHSIDETIVIENYDDPGMRIGGRWVDTPAVTASVTASVQIADGKVKELLPAGLRNRAAIEVWSLSEIRPLEREDGTIASRVRWDGDTYQVDVLEDWYENGRYWFALCTKVEQ
jgi:hypothetical protein